MPAIMSSRLVGFICIMTANAIVRRLDEESSLF